MVINMKFEKNKLFAAAVNPRTNHFVMALTAFVNFTLNITSGNIVFQNFGYISGQNKENKV